MSDRKKILVVDDEPETVDMLRKKLEGAGYEVFTACDGWDGISRARVVRPDLILMDVMMPVMDGIEACSAVKNDSELSSIPVIMVTGMASQIPSSAYSLTSGLDIEADDYIEKPVDLNYLLKRIKRILK